MFTSWYEALWVFFVYSFLGWCTEVIFHVVSQGKFVNRGFLTGPVCPIYGMGILAVVAALAPLQKNLLILYVGSVLITSAIELALGWLSKRILKERLWDYSEMPFNLGGYICLKFSLVWGLACLLVVRVLHPGVMQVVRWIPHSLGVMLLWVFSGLLLADFVLTGLAALQIPRQLKAAREVEKLLTELSFGIGEGLSGPVLTLLEKRPEFEAAWSRFRQTLSQEKQTLWQQRLEHSKALLGRANWTQRRLTGAYPHLKNSVTLQYIRRTQASVQPQPDSHAATHQPAETPAETSAETSAEQSFASAEKASE